MKNNKSLLLGSAAVLISSVAATGGARAADAIIIEPEPVEYVRVCDAYGAGWWYIPGTETCIRIGGYVRTTYSHTTRSLNSDHAVGIVEGVEEDGDGFVANIDAEYIGEFAFQDSSLNESAWDYRGRLNIDVNNETEWGTLSSHLRLQGGDDPSSDDANVGVDRAMIVLGQSESSFRVGYFDTYWTTNHAYGGGPATGAVISDGYYNYDQALFFDYTVAMGGIMVTTGVQDTDETTDMLDVYGGVNWASDFGTYAFTAIYDSAVEDFVYKGSATIPLGNWNLHGFYMYDPSASSQYVSASNFINDEIGEIPMSGIIESKLSSFIESQWGVQVSGEITDVLTVYGLYSQASGNMDDLIAMYPTAGLSAPELSLWTAGIAWTPVTGLTVNLEYGHEKRKANYGQWFVEDEELGNVGVSGIIDDETDTFLVRVTRSW
jgi:hypothetical protein